MVPGSGGSGAGAKGGVPKAEGGHVSWGGKNPANGTGMDPGPEADRGGGVSGTVVDTDVVVTVASSLPPGAAAAESASALACLAMRRRSA